MNQNEDEAIVVRKSMDGRITYWSLGAEKAFGYKRVEVIGRHVSIIIPFEWQDQEYAILDQLKAGDDLGVIKTVRRTKDGRLFQVELTTAPIRNSQGKIIGAEKRYQNFSDWTAEAEEA